MTEMYLFILLQLLRGTSIPSALMASHISPISSTLTFFSSNRNPTEIRFVFTITLDIGAFKQRDKHNSHDWTHVHLRYCFCDFFIMAMAYSCTKHGPLSTQAVNIQQNRIWYRFVLDRSRSRPSSKSHKCSHAGFVCARVCARVCALCISLQSRRTDSEQ